jgi:hypothetical protein
MISSSPEMRLRYNKACNDYNAAVDQRESSEFDQALLSLRELLKIFQVIKPSQKAVKDVQER